MTDDTTHTDEAAARVRAYIDARTRGQDAPIAWDDLRTVLDALADTQRRVVTLEAQQSDEAWESMVPQSCDAGVHADWAVAAEDDRYYVCAWCQLAEQRARADVAEARVRELEQELASARSDLVWERHH
jgi:hypothetical protein